jgi:hypothetical protein
LPTTKRPPLAGVARPGQTAAGGGRSGRQPPLCLEPRPRRRRPGRRPAEAQIRPHRSDPRASATPCTSSPKQRRPAPKSGAGPCLRSMKCLAHPASRAGKEIPPPPTARALPGGGGEGGGWRWSCSQRLGLAQWHPGRPWGATEGAEHGGRGGCIVGWGSGRVRGEDDRYEGAGLVDGWDGDGDGDGGSGETLSDFEEEISAR